MRVRARRCHQCHHCRVVPCRVEASPGGKGTLVSLSQCRREHHAWHASVTRRPPATAPVSSLAYHSRQRISDGNASILPPTVVAQHKVAAQAHAHQRTYAKKTQTQHTHFRILSCRERSADSTALLPVLAPHPIAALAASPPPTDEVYSAPPPPFPPPPAPADSAGCRPAPIPPRSSDAVVGTAAEADAGRRLEAVTFAVVEESKPPNALPMPAYAVLPPLAEMAAPERAKKNTVCGRFHDGNEQVCLRVAPPREFQIKSLSTLLESARSLDRLGACS